MQLTVAEHIRKIEETSEAADSDRTELIAQLKSLKQTISDKDQRIGIIIRLIIGLEIGIWLGLNKPYLIKISP
jgi:hypothetical protein